MAGRACDPAVKGRNGITPAEAALITTTVTPTAPLRIETMGYLTSIEMKPAR